MRTDTRPRPAKSPILNMVALPSALTRCESQPPAPPSPGFGGTSVVVVVSTGGVVVVDVSVGSVGGLVVVAVGDGVVDGVLLVAGALLGDVEVLGGTERLGSTPTPFGRVVTCEVAAGAVVEKVASVGLPAAPPCDGVEVGFCTWFSLAPGRMAIAMARPPASTIRATTASSRAVWLRGGRRRGEGLDSGRSRGSGTARVGGAGLSGATSEVPVSFFQSSGPLAASAA